MPAKTKNSSGKNPLKAIPVILLLILGIRRWYLLAQGIPMGMDIRSGRYSKVTVTDLRNGESAEFTAASDERRLRRERTILTGKTQPTYCTWSG